MAKYFRSKKIMRKFALIKYILYIIVTFIFLKLYIYSLVDINPANYFSTNTIIKDHYLKIRDSTINKPLTLLNYRYTFVPVVVSSPVVSVPDIKKSKSIYIYNTHQKESYASKETVVDATTYFKEQLEKNNVKVVVENGNIQEFLNANNYSYNYSYVASRYYIAEELSKNTYDLIIDLHRDALSKNKTTVTIEGKKYAKIMFVIGKKNSNYKKNHEVATAINNMVKKKYPSLTRGILIQDGSNVNGIYNQDINENMILIELGGNNNTYEEVKNTIDLLSAIIGEYLYGKEI
jgi:stage II sporulation protein P